MNMLSPSGYLICMYDLNTMYYVVYVLPLTTDACVIWCVALTLYC